MGTAAGTLHRFFTEAKRAGVAGSRALARGERTRAKLSRTVKLEPTATLAALAMVTERIGLVATATTTYNEPYNIARRFMSIDHISEGRAGWNLVTSQIEDESENFGFDQHMPHAERYERAAEFYEVVTGLWDSWEDGGMLRDKAGEFGHAFRAGVAEAAARVAAFAPELVVFFGSDHRRAFVDPVPAIADAAAAAGAWLHVDAAYAGSARVCPEFRTPGLERADSLVVNPHKWLFTPVDCSCLFTARPDDLRAAFALTPEYLRTSAEGVTNLNEYGPALGRRFRALKLWSVLRCFGRSGLQATIREHVRLAELFEGWVRDEPGWEVCAPRPYSVVCFRPDGDDARSEALLEAVNATGETYLSHTRLNDRHVLRLAIGNAATTEDDVRVAWQVLRREAARLGAGAPAGV